MVPDTIQFTVPWEFEVSMACQYLPLAVALSVALASKIYHLQVGVMDILKDIPGETRSIVDRMNLTMWLQYSMKDCYE